MAKRALWALERREHVPALARVVAVLEEVAGHAASVALRACADIAQPGRSSLATVTLMRRARP
jgi:hypothetical protein